MSRNYYLTCPSLKIYLWMGQGNLGNADVMMMYTGGKYLDRLGRFMNKTKGRVLRLIDEHDWNPDRLKWEEFENE